MEFGVTMFPTDYSMDPARLAQAVEARGFDALFIPDHSHIPASRDSPFRLAEELPADRAAAGVLPQAAAAPR